MKNVFNCGDIVTFHKGNSNGMSIYWWCKVLDLILRSEGDKSYDSYEVVTGCGDLNTDIVLGEENNNFLGKIRNLTLYPYPLGYNEIGLI